VNAERRAVLLLLGLATAGQGLRIWIGRPDRPPGEFRIPGGTPGVPGPHRDSSLAAARPLAPDERIDVDRAGPVELARLPRVGMALARTIVADRDAHGPFGSLVGLDRVPGVGPGLLAAISGHTSFSALGADGAIPIVAPETRRPTLNVNTATAADLERLPFIGGYLADRIVTFRGRHGPFLSVDSLLRVPGIGPATLDKIRNRLRVE
jgi:competence protein ComEA